MVLKCCVPGCRSNYSPPYVSVFRFPQNEYLRKKWLKKIYRKNYTITKNSVVCINHFSNEFVISEESFVDKTGQTVSVKRDRLTLTEDAYPTVIGDFAPLLSGKLPKKRRTWSNKEDEDQLAETDEEASDGEENKSLRINCFDDIVNYLSQLERHALCNTVIDGELLIFSVNNIHCPKIMNSVVVKTGLKFSFFKGETGLSDKQLKDLGLHFTEISTTRHIDSLVDIL